MRTEIIIGLVAILFIVVEFYAFQAFKLIFQKQPVFLWIYVALTVFTLTYLIYLGLSIKGSQDVFLIQRLVLISILSFVPKAVIAFGMFLEDVFRFISYLSEELLYGELDKAVLPSRKRFIAMTSVAIAGIPFFGILYGVIKGKYNYKVIKKTLEFPDLPAAFDGFKLVQISDIHSGSFDNYDKVAYGVDLINQQKGDIVLFTGDLVNNKASEMLPWKKLFSTIEAPYGKYSTLGNHDYGGYVHWPSEEAKKKNLKDLEDIHKEMGFHLMNNTNKKLENNGDYIMLLGVENWGLPPFPQLGDLDKALEGVKENDFCILMSHDPTHFDQKVVPHKKHIHLTLSGHTHGMQFGIEIPGIIKWSPVEIKYPKWAGLYESLGKLLYVNRGFGYIAFPGRVGIWPEITVIELKKS